MKEIVESCHEKMFFMFLNLPWMTKQTEVTVGNVSLFVSIPQVMAQNGPNL